MVTGQQCAPRLGLKPVCLQLTSVSRVSHKSLVESALAVGEVAPWRWVRAATRWAVSSQMTSTSLTLAWLHECLGHSQPGFAKGQTWERKQSLVLLSYCCYSKLPQTSWLLTHIYSRRILEVIILKWVDGAAFLLEALGENMLSYFFHLLEVAHIPWLMALHPSGLCFLSYLFSPT